MTQSGEKNIKNTRQEKHLQFFMNPIDKEKRIAILGGGPSGLFIFKRLLQTGKTNFSVDIFEAKNELGCGMPYSHQGAEKEHITNVSGNEIPMLVTSVMDWLATVPDDTLAAYSLSRNRLSEYKVLPRLLFGQYLNAQFGLLQTKAQEAGLSFTVHYNSCVTNITDQPKSGEVMVEINGKTTHIFGHVIVCTGHNWAKKHEGKIPGYFDSPYPPAKLANQYNHTIAIKGSSLTAIDAIRTLARHHGGFLQKDGRTVAYKLNDETPNFKLVMYSRQGLLPGVRFHLEDPHLEEDSMLSREEIASHIKENGGFLSLDYIFEKDFKDGFKEKQPEVYRQIKDMSMEEFVERMMGMREKMDAFELFKIEYAEAEKSIRRRESVYWKEMLAALSFAMNYPAKYFSAEDMLRLKKVLMPLISVVIAFVPQSSCEEMITLHNEGLLELIAVGEDSHVEPVEEGGIVYHYTDEDGKKYKTRYETYVDSTGQSHLSVDDFPFKGLVENGTISEARLPFRDACRAQEMLKKEDSKIEKNGDAYYLKVPGIAITDSFRVIETDGTQNPRVFMMAVPYMGGFNPDYSGLDFCEEASELIVDDIFNKNGDLPEIEGKVLEDPTSN